jgi:hypothetical protein
MRKATVAAAPGAAREFAARVTEYVNERHGLSVSYGAEINGDANIYWYADYESLGADEQALGSIMGDTEYWDKVVPESEGLFVPGSVHDTMVVVI